MINVHDDVESYPPRLLRSDIFYTCKNLNDRSSLQYLLALQKKTF